MFWQAYGVSIRAIKSLLRELTTKCLQYQVIYVLNKDIDTSSKSIVAKVSSAVTRNTKSLETVPEFPEIEKVREDMTGAAPFPLFFGFI
ncbi:hypothetical protein ACYCS5_02035 [Paenibacillus sp. SEL3]